MQKFIAFVVFMFVLFIASPVVKLVNDTLYDNYTYTSAIAAGINTTAPVFQAVSRGWPWIFPIIGIILGIVLFFRREEPEPYYPQMPTMKMPKQPKPPKQPKQVKQKNAPPPPPPLFFG